MPTQPERSQPHGQRHARRFPIGFAAIAAAVFAASCSGSGDTAPITEIATTTAEATTTPAGTATTTTTTLPPATTTSTTTDPPAVVETVPPSDPTTSAAAPTEPVETTPLDIPTDTVYAPDTIEGEVEQAVLGFYASFVRCMEQLPNCDVEQASQFTALDYGEANRTLIEGWNESGSHARNIDTYRYRVLRIAEFSDDRTEAIVETCTSTEVDIFIPATDEEPEQVTFGDPESRIQDFRVQKLGDLWYIAANRVLELNTGDEENLCP